MPKTLLVVDDSTTIRQAARLALAGEDWQVIEAPGVGEALDAVEAGTPDAVLCDAALGDPDGYELCRRLRRLPEMGPVPIVLMGAKATPETARAAGATATLPKPFGARELLEALEAAVESQAFSSDFADDTPLTLADLDGPLSFGAPRQEPAVPQGVEIIDLSGDEEFGELDLIEDLEPVAAPVEKAGRAPWEPLLEAQEAPGRAETAVVDVGMMDLFSVAATPDRAPGPAGLFSDAEREPRHTGEGEAVTGFEELLDLDHLEPATRAEEPSAPEPPPSWAPLEGATFDAADGRGAPFPEDRASHGEAVTPPAAPWESRATTGIGEATEQALREALNAKLTADSLLPTIQTVVERVVWEVVPPLAERLIQEAIDRLRRESPPT